MTRPRKRYTQRSGKLSRAALAAREEVLRARYIRVMKLIEERCPRIAVRPMPTPTPTPGACHDAPSVAHPPYTAG